jgi:hypothetical protein
MLPLRAGAIYWELRREGDGLDVNGTADLTVWLDAHLFTDDDGQGLEERLETRFRVESELLAYTYVPTPGELPPPEVFVQLLDYVLPLRDVALNLFCSALYDLLEAYAAREGRENVKVIYEVQAVDEDKNPMHHRVQAEVSDLDDIERLIRLVNDAVSRTSDDD